MFYFKKQGSFMCLVIAVVFLLVTVFEPITVFATQTPSQSVTQSTSNPEASLNTESLETEVKTPLQETEPSAEPSQIAPISEVIAPLIKGWRRVSFSKMKLSWTMPKPPVDGYQIEYSMGGDFAPEETFTADVNDGSAESFVVEGLEKNKKYNVRIRAYIKSEGGISYSAWSLYENKKTDFTSLLTLLKNNGRNFELRSSAGQSVGQHDVVQGACTDGTYAYYVMFSKSRKDCRILKCNLSDNKTIKVSYALPLNHGNDITYNADKNSLVAVHYNGHPYRLSYIDPETLSITGSTDVKIPETLEGATPYMLSNIKGFSAVAYSPERGEYVVRLIKSHNYLVLDGEMNPVKYITVSKAGHNVNQGINANADYIFDVQSKAGYYNTVIAYDWDGEYQYTVKVPVKYEMESLFNNGEKFYATTYTAYYQTYYTTHYKTQKVKWKKVRGKWKYKYKYKYKTVKYKAKWKKKKVKWKKVNGKWKYRYVWRYKTKRKKVKQTYRVAHKRLMRSNYVFDIGSI